ncbi:MAG: hypothetical protein ACREMH_08125 [Gemmatimonadales bacterium]
MRGYPAPGGCVPEALSASTDSTESVLVTFSGGTDLCYPNLVSWGIDMADPIGVDTPQGTSAFQVRIGPQFAAMPSPSAVAAGAYHQQMIEFDPPVSSVEFHYSRLRQQRALWGGQIVDADSMRVRAMARIPGTLSYWIYDSETLHSNVPRSTPPWDTWTHVRLSAAGDLIQWLWFDGALVVDDLRITRMPLTCTPSVQRGQVVTCEVTSPTIAVTSWEFTPDSSLPPVQEASSSKVWSGIGAIGGTVRAHVTDGAGARSYRKRFSVTGRPSRWRENWNWRPGPELTVADEELTSLSAAFGRNCPEKYATDSLCTAEQRSRLQPDPDSQPDSGFSTARITSGMNKGYWYVAATRYDMRRVANVHPGMLATSPRKHPVPGALLTKACKKALGVKPTAAAANANMNQMNQYCAVPGLPGTDMTIFIPAIWGHEGFGYQGGVGHETLGQAAAGEPPNDPYSAIEYLVHPDSATLVMDVLGRVRQIADDITRKARDGNPINGGPQGNYDPAQYATQMYVWEVGSNGALQWVRKPLTSGY